MARKNQSSNKKGNNFPDHNIDPKQKDDKWIMQYGKAFYADDLERGGSLFYNNRGRYKRNLLYAMGKQDVAIYKSQLGCDDSQRDSHINTSWAIHPVVPKFVEVIVGLLQKQDYDIQCNPIDPTSIDAEKQTKYKLRAKVMMEKSMAEIGILMGIEFNGPEQEMDPKTFEEIDIHMSMTYKHRMAIVMEEALALILELNEWDSISQHLSRDLAIYGAAVVKDYLGPDGLPKARRVNPFNFKTLFSKTSNFKGCEAFGEVETYSMVEFEKMAEQQFTREEKKKIYESFSKTKASKSLNSNWELDNSNSFSDDRFGSEYDDYVLKVFDFEFSSVNTDYYSTKPNRFGNTTTGKKSYGYEAPKDSDTEKVQKDNYAVWYKGIWIIGTDFIYNTGVVTDLKVTKSSFSEAMSSYTVEVPGMSSMNTISPVDKMEPAADNIQLYFIQLRRAVARARVKGLMIEVGALEGISKGEGLGDFTPIEILSMYQETGNVLYRALDDQGKRMAPPLAELENGMAKDVMTFVTLINTEMNHLRDAVGINEVADASSPDPDLLKGVAEISLSTTNNVLYSLYAAKKSLKTRVCYSLTLRLQQAIKKRKISGYAAALGSTDKKFIEVNKDIALHEFGMIVENMPGERELQEFEMQLKEAQAQGQITIDHYYYIKGIRILKNAQTYLAFVVKKKREEDQQMVERNSQINGEEQRKSLEQASMIEAQKATQETDDKIRLAEAVHSMEMIEIEEKHQNDMELEGIKHHGSSTLNRQGQEHENQHRQEDKEAEGVLATPESMAPSAVT